MLFLLFRVFIFCFNIQDTCFYVFRIICSKSLIESSWWSTNIKKIKFQRCLEPSFSSQNGPRLDSKFYVHPNYSQQFAFLVRWPSEPFEFPPPHCHPSSLQSLWSSSHTLLLTGPGAALTHTSLPTLPSGCGALCSHNPGEFRLNY